MLKESKINLIKIVTIAIFVNVLILSIIIMTLPFLKKVSIDTYRKGTSNLNTNYSSIHENAWNISNSEEDNVIATLSEDGTLTISGTGEMIENVFDLEIPWDEIINKTKSIIIESGVTSIGSYAFASCENLTSVEIANTVVSIGESVFSYCENLTTIEIPSSVKSIGEATFDGCNSLTTIEVSENNAIYKDSNGVLYTKDGKQLIKYPEGKTDTEYTILSGTTSIENRAFASSYNLTKIEIPNSVTNIGFMAFDFCHSLITIEIPSSVTSIGYGAFGGCGNLKSIEVVENNENYMDDNGVLYSKDATQLIKYPEGKEEIEYTILNTTTIIEESAFSFNLSLTNVEIPNAVEEIGDNAFLYCEKLVEVKIPSSVINIGYGVFDGCNSLISIEVSENNENYIDDNGVLYTKDSNQLIKYPSQREGTEYIILSGTTSIEDSAFEECDKLINIQIPNGVESIGYGAFSRCDNLITLEIPSSMRDMSNSAFDDCCKLKSIEVDENNEKYMDDNGVLYTKDGIKLIKYPEGKEEKEYIILNSTKIIEFGAFANCNNLEKLQIPSTVTEIYDGTFYRCENITIICEKGSTAERYAKKNNIKYRIIGEDSTITSTTLTVDEEKLIIKGVKPKTTVREIKQNLQSEVTYQILDKEGNVVTDETIIGTDNKVRMDDGKEYTVIVFGDFTGDGKISVAELARTSRIAVQAEEPILKEQMIIDVNMDNKIAVSDLAAISRFAIQ